MNKCARPAITGTPKAMIKDFHKTAIVTAHGEISYRSMLQHIDHFALHTPKGKNAKTIIFSENREGWIYAFFSVWKNGGIAIPVDASATANDLAYILKDSGCQNIWASDECLATAMEAIALAGMQVRLFSIDEHEDTDVPEYGSEAVAPSEWSRNPEETAIIIYTSGTTGSPKGVMLSFANLFANIRGVSEEVCIFNSERRALILLPLHHVLPLQGCMIAPILLGGGVAISPGMTGPEIMDTLSRGKVAIFIGVPRLWQTLYSGIMKQINAHAITRGLFRLCGWAKSPTLSRIIFRGLHQKMGGHIRFCVSGGAALDAEIGRGLETLGLNLLEGYGMTETAPIIAFTRPGDYIPGCVGLPLPSVECKIIPSEMGVTENGQVIVGELCAKGPNVMQGYYNKPEETAATIDRDGFIHTGDLARFDKKGRIYITGRCKEIIILSNGKNVQPSEIEAKLDRYVDLIHESAVTQRGDMLCAIIVPHSAWAKDLTDQQVEDVMKREVLEPYNRSVPQYKRVMSLCIFRGELPRTKLEKLQRFKLKDILDGQLTPEKTSGAVPADPDSEVYRILKQYIEDEKKVTVRPTDHIETGLGMDSLDRIGLQVFIENSFGVQVTADSMTSFSNLSALVKHIEEHKTRMEVEEIDWNRLLSQADHPSDYAEGKDVHKRQTSPLMCVWAKLMQKFISIYNGMEVVGRENIPATGPYILAPNHQSFMDAPIALAGLTAAQIKQCYFYATEDHVQGAVRRTLAQRNNIIIMERARLKDSILEMAAMLKRGHNLVIFPEGTRTRTGRVGDFKKTFAILAAELNVPIVPVRISGAFEAWPRDRRLPLPKPVKVEYLKPIVPEAEMEDYDKLCNRVRQAIIAQE